MKAPLALVSLAVLLAATPALASAPDASAYTVTPITGASETIATLANQSGVLLDAFKQAGDADDTASLGRACAAGVPILMGPRIYNVSTFSCAATPFILRGVPGVSTIKRNAAINGTFFGVTGATVYFDGVTFDLNSSVVSGANEWGVLLNGGAQTVVVRNSVFKNNSGMLGSCFALIGGGPGAGGSFTFENNEVANCTFNSAYFASVVNGVISRNNIHDNPAIAVSVQAYLTPSSTNYARDIIVSNNVFARNANAVGVGGFAPPYVFGTPSAVNVLVDGNDFIDGGSTSYQLALQGDHLKARNNVFSNPTQTPFGAVDCNARYTEVAHNEINLTGANYGIDCGGAVNVDVRQNQITMNSGAAIDIGGTQNSTAASNVISVSGSAAAVLLYATESDGAGVPFPTTASGIVVERNRIAMNGASSRGVQLFDNAGGYPGAVPTQVRDNEFVGVNSASSSYAVFSYGASNSVEMSGNKWNGSGAAYVDPNGNGDVVFDDVFDKVIGYSSTARVRSIMSTYQSWNWNVGSVLYVYPTSGGANYGATTTTISVSGAGCAGVSVAPMISQGVIVGARVNNRGSGCTGTPTAAAVDSGGTGSGAVFALSTTPALPQYRQIKWVSYGNLLQGFGGLNAIADLTPLQTNAGNEITFAALASGLYWAVAGYKIPTFASTALPTCNAYALGATINISGSSSGKWSARCDGGAWRYPDDSAAP